MPRPVVLSDIKVSLKARILTESEANGTFDRLYECKGGNCNDCWEFKHLSTFLFIILSEILDLNT